MVDVGSEQPANAEDDRRTLTPRSAMVVMLMMVTLMFFFDDVLGLINGGGVFSVIQAYEKLSIHQNVIDVDGAGLRTLFIMVFTAIAVLTLLIFRWNIYSRSLSLVVVLFILGSSYIVDGYYGERIVTCFLAAHGYRRCAMGDYRVGRGKGTVWMDRYVRASSVCQTQPTPDQP